MNELPPIFLLLVIFPLSHLYGQEPSQQDSVKVILGTSAASDSLGTDTTKVIEDAPLDIAQNRGIFIVTPDQNMQLRILGSVRYRIVFDNKELESKNAFSTFEIPTGDLNQPLPNYFNGLDQTRLGFEVTRRTGKGNVFIRLETDFAGNNGYRIRHAYGQYGSFILGQTWSLFSTINARPATVSARGPTGSVTIRTPQVRYTGRNLIKSSTLSLAAEYFKPELQIPDSLAVESFQLIPDLTARLERRFGWGTLQLSAVLPMLTARTADREFILRPGWGFSVSAVVDSWANGKWYMQGAGGRAITRYFNDLTGKGLDILFDPENQQEYLPFAFGMYVSYEHAWRSNIYSNFTYGLQVLEKKSFTPDGIYRRGNSFRFNTFWDVVEGAKVGAEVIFGLRVDKDGEKGRASRINLLFYYDF